MLVISSVNVYVQEAALVEVRAASCARADAAALIRWREQVDQQGFKVLAYCNERDSVDEQHQWREVRQPSVLQHHCGMQSFASRCDSRSITR
jgi:hypothetical protein